MQNYEKQTGLVGGVLSKVISWSKERSFPRNLDLKTNHATSHLYIAPSLKCPASRLEVIFSLKKSMYNTVLLQLKRELKEWKQITFCFIQR